MAGSTLGRYRLVQRIATGGMGEVYRGLDVGWGGIERPVAIKVIAGTFAREPDFVSTFADEARLSFLLSHSNVVHVRDIGQTDDTLFIAMEWVEGGDLGGILQKLQERVGQPMPMRFAVLVAVEAARGLDYAHRLCDTAGNPLHVIHRDISPSNLLVSFEGEVKITDFGIARSRLKTSPSLPGALKGKIGYLAPEQAKGEDVDKRADVFALGAVLYEMLTGQNPFTHNCTEREAMARVQMGAFQSPRLVMSALPQGLEAIVLRAMAPGRDKRYESCGQMREDLEAFARREGYALSPSDLGGFVRELMSDGELKEIRPATQSKPRITAPKPFDVALGESLAMLSSSDDLEPPPAAAVTAPGKKHAENPRTVAIHPVISVEKPTAAEKKIPPADSIETEQIPKSYSPRAIWIGLLAIGVVVSVGVTLAQRAASPPEVLPPVIAPAPPKLAAAPPPLPKVVERIVPPPEPRPHAPRPKVAPNEAPAKLSIDSDVPANIYVDGQFIQTTPVVAMELTAGAHLVRAESSASGLRLIPREETVMLKAGESRHLQMDLK
jgi:serine/threonine protein kinase